MRSSRSTSSASRSRRPGPTARQVDGVRVQQSTAATVQRAAIRFGALPKTIRWLAFITLALGILVLRRPETITRAEFFYEDGQVFYVGAFFGGALDQVFRQYEGYLLVVPRLIAMLERLVPPASAPLVGNVASLLIVAGLAAYIASDRLANVIPERRTRIVLAIALLVLPGAWETLGSMTLVQWYLALFLVLAGIAGPPASRAAAVAELTAIAAAGLTGPFSLLLAPVYWVRAWRSRDRWSMATAAVITIAAAVQLVVLLLSGERSGAMPSLYAIGEVMTVRLWASVIGGLWMSALIPVGIPAVLAGAASLLLIAGLVLVLPAVPRAARFALAYGALAIVGATLLDQPAGLPVSPYLAGRYFLLLSAVVAFAAAIAVLHIDRLRPGARVAALAIAGLVLLGTVGDFRLPAHSDYHWAERAACIGGPVPCDLPVEFPNVWTVHWPGSSGTYIQPNP